MLANLLSIMPVKSEFAFEPNSLRSTGTGRSENVETARGSVRSRVWQCRAVAALLAVTPAAAGCTRASDTAMPGPHSVHSWIRPGVLRVEMTSLPNTLDPALRTQLAESFINRFIFDPLLDTRPDGTIVPKLATTVPTLRNGGISRDGRTIVYHLRPHVLWHDGRPFTSADVAFTFRAYMDSRNNVSIRDAFDRVRAVDTPDPLTAVVRLARPYTPFVRQFETIGRVLPSHVFTSPGVLNGAPFNASPVGTGPFRFVRWLRGDRIELASNDAYYLGRPKIRRIVVRFVPNDGTAINALLTHEVDWLWNGSPFAYRRLGAVASLHAALIEANAVHGLEMNGSHPPLDDVRVRQAISYAIDRASLVRNVAYGATVAADADLPRFMRSSGTAAFGQRYDPAAGRALLDAAGWRLQNGARVKAGRGLAFTLAFAVGNVTVAAEVVQVQAMLRAMGIGAEAKGYDPNQLFAPAQTGGILESGKFDLDLSGYFNTDDPDDATLFSCATRAPAGPNAARYCTPAFEAMTRLATSMPDGAARRHAYDEIERTLAHDAPWAFVWWPRIVQVYDTDFKGFEVAPGKQSLDLQDWRIGT